MNTNPIQNLVLMLLFITPFLVLSAVLFLFPSKRVANTTANENIAAIEWDGKLDQSLCQLDVIDRTALFVDGRFDLWQGWGEEGYIRAKEFGLKRLKITIL